MQKTVGRLIGALFRLLGLSMLATAVLAAVIALRHMLDTPQQLESELPGEARIYRWKQGHIFYTVLGAADAPPLLLLHTLGVGASAYEMRRIMELLAADYRIYAPDLLGFGLSDHPRIAYAAETYTTLCRDFLTDVAARPATIVASRVSCNYAVTIAATAPALCERLVLISPVALYGDERKLALMSGLAQVSAVKSLLYPILSTRLVLHSMLARQRSLTDDADLDHFYAAAHQLGAEHAPMALLAGTLTENVTGQFEKVQQPTLIIWGADALNGTHHITGPRGVSKQVQVELFRNAGLAVHEEHPDEVVATIRRWSQQQSGTRPGASTSARGQSGMSSSMEARSLEKPRAQLEPEPTDVTEPEQASDSLSSVQEEKSEHPPIQQEQADNPVVEAYCIKCKRKTTVQDAHEVTMKNGRVAVRGTCAVCGTNLYRIGRLALEQ